MRLLSYNIHKGFGGRDRLYRFNRIIEVIEQLKPDLICLQEVDQNVKRSQFDDQPRMLAEYFQFPESIYQQNVFKKEGGYGNLLMSRWELANFHHVNLKMLNYKTRGAQAAVIDTPEGPLHLVGCHLGLLDKLRHMQVDHLMKHQAFKEAEKLPTLIVGDFNDWLNKLAEGPFQSHGYKQITEPISNFRSFPAFLPLGNLDKAFAHGPIVVENAMVVSNKLTKAASDHLPLAIDFHIDQLS